ncbi:hypothetical protein FE257_007530 [Aspergillus nanangensis]|uniref:DNA replication regulator Sld3 C-terminal domain-containing protein n=1 Tax=Aspergillus nanangensis TaxID=2582783 RepID=A0AAD4CPA9_ASPNN|nr:hypothetical protein FE257_007530 [Aspergillus nanangensis]
MASCGSPSALESLSPNQLHRAPQPPSRKRKSCHAPNDWAHAASLSDEPFVLEPLTVLPRSRLPLTWLDYSFNSLSLFQPGSLFVANIPVLEADDLHSEPVVLAVRLASDNGLYVVERVKKTIYALSKLAKDIEEGDVFVAVKGWSSASDAIQLPLPRRRSSEMEEGNCWRMAQIETPVVDSLFSTNPPKLGVSIVFSGVDDGHVKDISPLDSIDGSRAPSMAPQLPIRTTSNFDTPMSVALQDLESGVSEDPVTVVAETDMMDTLQSPQDILDKLREQYIQALYVSKTSVAYFAKGPLARCRAAFQLPGSESSKPSDLLDFYREATLTAKKMDLKYRETIPSILQDFLLSVSDDEPTARTKRKSKKKKLGKNGLYPEEDQFVRRWWKNRSLTDHGVPVETSREADVKKNVADLRLRETQLQILLILETLALEVTASEETQNTANCNEGSKDQPSKARNPKTKKAQDMNVMLELHLDRLCIWHTVSFEDSALLDPAKTYNNHHMAGKKIESDAIRDFCTEVIIPFYASRLPDKCKSITSKLGVSAAVSPFPKKTSRGEPGSAVERQPSQKQHRRSLHRVATDEKAGRRPSLGSKGRSNTAPSHVEMKRDSIEPLLPILSSNVRGGIQKAKRVENREVDLNAVAKQHETKLKKVQMLSDQKKELDAAILALRKPNRQLVAKDIAKDADQRRVGGSARKPKNPVRNPLGQGVQVAATPRGSRKKDASAGLPPISRSLSRSFTQPTGSVFDSSPQMVVPGSASFSGTPGTRDVGAIQETPTRRPAKPLGSFNDIGSDLGVKSSGNLFRVPRRPAPRPTEIAAPSTPISSRHVDSFSQPLPMMKLFEANSTSSMVVETPPRLATTAVPVMQPSSVPAALRGPPPKMAIMGTPPVKRVAALGVPNEPAAVPVTPDKSIYEQLGWDDDELAL